MSTIGAIIGFILGFVLGLLLLNYILKGIPKEKLRQDKDLQLKYGGLNWIIALAFAVAGWYLFPFIFGA